MRECLSEWWERFRKIHLKDEFDTEDFLARIVVDLDRDWECRLVDKAFITEFIEHKEEDNYKKALLLFREFMDDDRLHWWDGTDEVILSEKMDRWLKEFWSLLVRNGQYYKRIYPFQTMFYEFLQNGNRIEYRAAIELLKLISDENREEGKIIEKVKRDWDLVSRNVTHNTGRLRVKRYFSVMANRALRKKYFGF